jgi:RNA polymerase sigma-70 factor (ECF subfamily)
VSTSRELESTLARRLLAGDESAFDEFVGLFRPRIFHHAMLMCGHRDDAEEVTQDALLKVFENFDQLREPDRVRAWVFRIARNACYLKRRKSVYAPVEEIGLDELMPAWKTDGQKRILEIADWSALPDDLASREQMNELLEQAIRELPETYRQVMSLRDIEELSTAETAEVLGLSEDVVKQRLHRARLAVRQKLDRHFRSLRSVQ